MTEETKIKLRQANIIQFSDPESLARHEQGMKHWSETLSEETRRKMSEGSAKARAKLENRQKVAEGIKNFWDSMNPEQRREFCAKREAKQEHPKLNDEKKKSLSEAIKNAWSDPVRKSERLSKYFARRYGR